MQQYQYQPLHSEGAPDPDLPRIRLAQILPGAPQDPVLVELSVVALPPASPPAYEALSYVWGTQREHEGEDGWHCSVSIIASTKPAGHPVVAQLHITHNLEVALRSLRPPPEASPRRMWIDAVCIDQSNIDERSSQIPIMGHIFRLASRVVVWLGPAEDTSDEACDLLAAVSERVTSLGTPCTVQPKPGSSITPGQIHRSDWCPWDSRQATAIYNLLRRPWFERVWVRQEIGLASPASIVACGTKTVSWPCFKEALLFVLAKSNALPLSAEDWPRFVDLCGVLEPIAMFKGPLDFCELRQYISPARCADDRDRVYAVLSLLGASGADMEIVPDYRLPPTRVYVDATAKWIGAHRSLDILRFCGEVTASSNVDSEGVSPPSWVLDPRTRPGASPLENHPAYVYGPLHNAVPFHLDLSEAGKETLRVSAARISSVRSVHPFVGLAYADAITNIRFALPPDFSTATYVDGATPMLEAYCAALGAGRLLRRRDLTPEMIQLYHGSQSIPALYEDTLDLMRLVFSSGQQAATEHGRWTLTTIFSGTASNRVLIVTDDGHVGLGPKGTRSGDSVYAVLGCTSPLLLRASGASSEEEEEEEHAETRFGIVGECYCHAFMASEAILGPLPGGTRIVQTMEPGGSHYECFFEKAREADGKEEEERSGVDPRMSGLFAAVWPGEANGGVDDAKGKELADRFAALPGEEKVALLKEHVGVAFEDVVLV